MSDLTTPPLPTGLCGIQLPGHAGGSCVRTLGHMGRCSWDTAPATDPRHIRGTHTQRGVGTVNLLRPKPEEADTIAYITEHGDRYTYHQGCRCLACRLANADYQREYRAARR